MMTDREMELYKACSLASNALELVRQDMRDRGDLSLWNRMAAPKELNRVLAKYKGDLESKPSPEPEIKCVPYVAAPASAVKLPERFESHKINKGDFVKISFNGAQLTLSHNAEVLYVPVEFGDYWILKDVYTGDVHYVSELCTITKLFEKTGV